MKFLLLLPLLCTFALAQTPEEGFTEISPEQEKKIREREERKLISKKRLEAKVAAEKRAAEKKAEEEKKAAAEKKKADEARAYSEWLISERDRKMKEAAASKAGADSAEAGEMKNSKSSGAGEKIPHTRAGGLEEWAKKNPTPCDPNDRAEWMKQNPGKGGRCIQKVFISQTHEKCEKTQSALAWEKEYRRLKGEDIRARGARAGYPSITEEKLQEFLCNCRFPEGVKFPSSLKVIGVGGYEGKYKGEEARHSGMHPETDVTIKVNSIEPVILAISVYEPVRWKIQGPVAGIVIIGYYRQTIDVEGQIPVLKSLMLAESVMETGKFALGSNQCKSSDDALILGPVRDTETIFHEGNEDAGLRDRKMLDDRSRLIFGKSLASYSYNYTFPEVLEVNP